MTEFNFYMLNSFYQSLSFELKSKGEVFIYFITITGLSLLLRVFTYVELKYF